MKRDLESQIEAHSMDMTNVRNISQTELPFSSEKTTTEAFEIIENYKKKIAKAKEREASLANGLAIFGIPPSEHSDLTALIKDIDYLSQIWRITVEWNEHWERWKNGQFNDLNVEEMENEAANYVKKVGRLGREIKGWKVWESMKVKRFLIISFTSFIVVVFSLN
jgi:dynein heavy chain